MTREVPPAGRRLVEVLREADAELARQRLSPEAEQRLQALLAGPSRGPRRRAFLLLAAPASAALVAAAIVLLWWPARRPPGPPLAAWSRGFQVLAGQARPAGQALECQSQSCRLAAGELGLELELGAGSSVERAPRGLRLRRGEARFEVTRRPRAEGPLRVLVSHGYIEVLGTVFRLWQGPASGGVSLERGAIRFVADDGRRVALRPGQSLSWPLRPPETAAAPAASQATAPPAARPRPLAGAELEALLESVDRMRSQGRHAELALRLRQALPRVGDLASRERLSFELGSLLGRDLRQVKQACSHWRWHLKRFGTRRYGQEIQAARAGLGCTEEN